MKSLQAFWLTVLMFGSQVAQAEAEKKHLEVGTEVSRFTLKVVNTDVISGRFVGIDDFYGPSAQQPKKAVLLTFFATYCEPCKREMPFLAELYRTYESKGLMVLSVSIDKEAEQIEFIKSLAQKSQVTFPVLSDNYNIVAKRYLISTLPCVYLIDAEGKILWANVGYDENVPKKLLAEVLTALGESNTDPLPADLAKHLSATLGKNGSHKGADSKEAAQEDSTAPAEPNGVTPDANPKNAKADKLAKRKAKKGGAAKGAAKAKKKN